MMINFKNTYKPLPSCVTIKESGIHGLGLFATEDIPEDTELGLMRLFYYGSWIRTALGSYPNHVDTDPNCFNRWSLNDFNDDEYYLVTTKNISIGDELTLTYKMGEYHKPADAWLISL
mgnify:CR=1 FL=1